MARKIKVGEWVIGKHNGKVSKVTKTAGFNDCELGKGQWCSAIYLTKLPASPATLAKSHRLLVRHDKAYMRYTETGEGWDEFVRANDALSAHLTKLNVIAGKRGKK